MVAVTEYNCDRCELPGAEHLGPFDLGDGPKTIDLDAECQRAVGLPVFLQMLVEYGEVVDTPPFSLQRQGRKSSETEVYRCPVCREDKVGMANTRLHLVNVHHMSKVEASQAVKPPNPTSCPVCGYVAAGLGGYARHAKADHPDHAELFDEKGRAIPVA